jgi:hypothetical protein
LMVRLMRQTKMPDSASWSVTRWYICESCQPVGGQQ